MPKKIITTDNLETIQEIFDERYQPKGESSSGGGGSGNFVNRYVVKEIAPESYGEINEIPGNYFDGIVKTGDVFDANETLWTVGTTWWDDQDNPEFVYLHSYDERNDEIVICRYAYNGNEWEFDTTYGDSGYQYGGVGIKYISELPFTYDEGEPGFSAFVLGSGVQGIFELSSNFDGYEHLELSEDGKTLKVYRVEGSSDGEGHITLAAPVETDISLGGTKLYQHSIALKDSNNHNATIKILSLTPTSYGTNLSLQDFLAAFYGDTGRISYLCRVEWAADDVSEDKFYDIVGIFDNNQELQSIVTLVTHYDTNNATWGIGPDVQFDVNDNSSVSDVVTAL